MMMADSRADSMAGLRVEMMAEHWADCWVEMMAARKVGLMVVTTGKQSVEMKVVR